MDVAANNRFSDRYRQKTMAKNQKKRNLKEKIIGASGSVSGAASVLGSWQVCHNVCLGIIALLAIIGITITGMPLAFLTKVAMPLWIVAFLLLIVIIGLYLKKECISHRIIMLNSGFIIAGIPFAPLQKFSAIFWTIGGILIAASITLFIKDRLHKRCCT